MIAGKGSPERPRTREGAMEPADRGSVTFWVDAVPAGDQEAASQLRRRYFESLVQLARSKFQSRARGAADEEDVALSACDSATRLGCGLRSVARKLELIRNAWLEEALT
jgi:hypothetical protein